jgi:hypothetical protein
MTQLVQSLRESRWRLFGALVVWVVVGVLVGLPATALVHWKTGVNRFDQLNRSTIERTAKSVDPSAGPC